jgi:hypothetical protein
LENDDKVVISTILSTVLIAVIGIQNAVAFDASTGAHIIVSGKHIVTIHSGFVVSHYELGGTIKNDGTETSPL